MSDPDPFDGTDAHLSERMDRAVGGLHAPDVTTRAMARGRRQRTHRRVAYGASGLAAVTALALAVPAFADGWPGGDGGPSAPSVAADPAPTDPTSATPPTTAPDPDEAAVDACGSASTAWWSKSTEQITADLSTLLPDGVRIARTTSDTTGLWEGTVAAGDDTSVADLTLLPPPGVLGPLRTLDEVSRLGPCGGGANEPAQAVRPCDDVTGAESGSEERQYLLSCEEIRSEGGALVGIVTEAAQLSVAGGQEQPTDQTYLTAVADGPEGGHVQLVVGDVPALTKKVLRRIVTDPVWTS